MDPRVKNICFSFFFNFYIAYQIKGNEEYDNMQGTFLMLHTPDL